MLKKIIKSKVVQFMLMLIRLLYWPLYLVKRKKMNFKIMSSLETTEYLHDKKISISRFGDGELNLIFRNRSIGFQSYSDKLRVNLVNVAKTGNNNKLMLALPFGLKETKGLKLKEKAFWWSYTVRNAEKINDLFARNTTYLNTNFTRTIGELTDQENAKLVVKRTMELWEGRDVLIIEGVDTRFGVGNTLLNKANNVFRILAPAENSYSKIEEIFKKTDEVASKINKPLILLALGPTATLLACSLSSKYQAIDIGHFDLMYEEFRQRMGFSSNVDTRYNNEKTGGEHVNQINDTKYKSEIKYVIS